MTDPPPPTQRWTPAPLLRLTFRATRRLFVPQACVYFYWGANLLMPDLSLFMPDLSELQPLPDSNVTDERTGVRVAVFSVPRSDSTL